MHYFHSADILLPKQADLEKWAVIACDQYTSQPEYWQHLREFIGNAESTLNMFFPEASLNNLTEADYKHCWNTMQTYVSSNFFQVYKDSYIYVERTLESGAVRQGIVGAIDLEYYDYVPKSNTKIFATEATVLQRVPPRVALRKQSLLEFSHTVIFCDDSSCKIIESVAAKCDVLPKIYDFDLNSNGGHITGFLLQGENEKEFETLLGNYEVKNPYLVGDGNHSLVTAKLCYDALKEANPEIDFSGHPARYAMVELENIHSSAMVFEPIYRTIVCNSSEAFLNALIALDTPGGGPVTWLCGDKSGIVHLYAEEGELLIEALQRFLDHWVDHYGGTVDYIHDAAAVAEIAQKPDTIGFLLPDIQKSILFPYILSGKVMPKKTFSIGHACEKRYYLEGRKIQ